MTAETSSSTPRRGPVLALVVLYAGLAALYAWQSTRHLTPTIFTDELEFAQLSRSFAETGHATLRGGEPGHASLYAYLASPAWWIDDVGVAYGVVKLIGTLAMAAVVFPAYALARFVVGRWWALFAAAGAGAAPALAYAPILVDEPVAYPVATLALYAMVRYTAAPSARALGLAAVAVAVAYLARTQLAVLGVVLGIAVLATVARTPRVARWRQTWTRGDMLGAVVLATGLLVVAGALVSSRSEAWYVATAFNKDRMLEYTLWAIGALAIGIGVLPLIAGLAALVPPRGERLTSGRRAFTVVAVSSFAVFVMYTAVKVAYLSRIFATLTLERNLIYLVPLLFTGTALLLERRRGRWWAIVAASALTLYLVVTTPYSLAQYPNYEAHGLAILALANRLWRWPEDRIENVMIAITIGWTLVLLALPYLRRIARPLVIVVVAASLTWTLTAQIYAANAEENFTEQLYGTMPKPANWVDRATGGESTVVLGQGIVDSNPLYLLEFWNRSVGGVWSLDGTASGPGRVVTPNLEASNGTLTDPESDWAITVNGVSLAGDPVQRAGVYDLYRLTDGLRLRDGRSGVSPDGWMSSQARLAKFDVEPGTPGLAAITLSREAWCGRDKPGNVTVAIGPVKADENGQPQMESVTDRGTGVLHSCERKVFALRAPAGPWIAEITVDPTFSPKELDPSLTDVRQLGAVVGFEYTPLR